MPFLPGRTFKLYSPGHDNCHGSRAESFFLSTERGQICPLLVTVVTRINHFIIWSALHVSSVVDLDLFKLFVAAPDTLTRGHDKRFSTIKQLPN